MALSFSSIKLRTPKDPKVISSDEKTNKGEIRKEWRKKRLTLL